jgi:hypothetical protein
MGAAKASVAGMDTAAVIHAHRTAGGVFTAAGVDRFDLERGGFEVAAALPIRSGG